MLATRRIPEMKAERRKAEKAGLPQFRFGLGYAPRPDGLANTLMCETMVDNQIIEIYGIE